MSFLLKRPNNWLKTKNFL